jgi:hypothetical protein
MLGGCYETVKNAKIALNREQFMNGAMRLIDGGIRVSAGA